MPPFRITPHILTLSQDIARELGVLFGQKRTETPLQLRRTNNIKTIQASLAIEGNTLTLDQVTDLFEGRRVIGPAKDIVEVKNALAVYEDLKSFDPLVMEDLLLAHKILMESLIEENGRWRSKGVGIFKGKEVSHVAPPAKRVSDLMVDLFTFLEENREISWLMKACIFHYEFEFIHPFADGNGRMGRLWQQLLLIKEDPVFEFIPVEVMIKDHQQEYYEALGKSDDLAESTPFIEFSLGIIHKALVDYGKTTVPLPRDFISRLHFAKTHITHDWFSRKDYLDVHKDISTATASRDLLLGVQNGLLKSKGEKNQVLYRWLE